MRRHHQQEEALRDWIAELALLLGQGTSIPRSLRMLSRWEQAPYGSLYQQASVEVYQRLVERGLSLSQALAQSPHLFPRPVVGSVYCGETASNLREAARILADYAYHKRYPLFFPEWEPTPDYLLALWCRLVGMMFDAGVLVLDIFEAASLVGGTELEEASLTVHDWIRGGGYVSEALAQHPLFRPPLPEMVRTAEAKNEVGTAMREFAAYLETALAHGLSPRRPMSRFIRGWRSLWRAAPSAVRLPPRAPGEPAALALPQPERAVLQTLQTAMAEASTHLHVVPNEEGLKVSYLVEGFWQELHSFRSVRLEEFLGALQEMASPLQPSSPSCLRWRREMDTLEIGWQRQGDSLHPWLDLRIWHESSPRLLSDTGMLEACERLLPALHTAPPGWLVVAAPSPHGRSTSLIALLYELLPRGPRRLILSEAGQGSLPAAERLLVEEGDFRAALSMSFSFEAQILTLQSMDDPSLWPLILEAVERGRFVVAAFTSPLDAVGVLERLRERVEREALARSLLGVVAQRLVRRPCVECRKEYHPSPQKLEAFGVRPEWLGETPLYLPNQCDHCRLSGYRGQTGLFEVLLPDEAVREWLCSRDSPSALREYLALTGHRTLLQDGIRLLRMGWTTLEELDRVLSLRHRSG